MAVGEVDPRFNADFRAGQSQLELRYKWNVNIGKTKQKCKFIRGLVDPSNRAEEELAANQVFGHSVLETLRPFLLIGFRQIANKNAGFLRKKPFEEIQQYLLKILRDLGQFYRSHTTSPSRSQ